MNQNPNNAYGSNPNYPPPNQSPNYPPTQDARYGSGQPSTGPSGQPPSGPSPNYGQYAPNAGYGSSFPYPPPVPGADGMAGPYDQTVFSQQNRAAYPAYPAPGGPGSGAPLSSPGYSPSLPGIPGSNVPPNNPGYGAPQASMPGYAVPPGPNYGMQVGTPGYGVPGGLPLQPPEPPAKRSGIKAVLIPAIALLVIVCGVLGVVLYNTYQTNVQNSATTATAQVRAQTTGTAQAGVNASATVSAAATATYAKTHYPFSSNLVLNDPLKDNSNVSRYGWDVGNGCAFSNGAYEATESKANFILPCTAESTNFANFTFEIQMTIKTGGTGADGGVFFRANMSSDALYIFFLDTQGNFELDLRANSSGSSTRKLSAGTIAGFAAGFYQLHTIGIVANGSQLTAYVDQKQVAQESDPTYTSGQIGVISDYGSSATTVAYSNAKVWQL